MPQKIQGLWNLHYFSGYMIFLYIFPISPINLGHSGGFGNTKLSEVEMFHKILTWNIQTKYICNYEKIIIISHILVNIVLLKGKL